MPRALLFCACIAVCCAAPALASAAPLDFRKLAHDYYAWRDAAYPVATSAAGDHRFDDKLTDFRTRAVIARRQHVTELLTRVRAAPAAGLPKDDQIDLLLLRSQLTAADFFGRRMDSESADPQLYVNECSNAIFSFLQKEYAPRRTRALAATQRLAAMPKLLRSARENLTRPVKLYASLAIAAARGGDDLYTTSLMTLANELSPTERASLVSARDAALRELHTFADLYLNGALLARDGAKVSILLSQSSQHRVRIDVERGARWRHAFVDTASHRGHDRAQRRPLARPE